MALGEIAIHTSPPRPYVRLRSLLPTRFSSFPFVSPLLFVFPVFPFIHLRLSFPLVLDLLRVISIIRIISLWRIYLCFGFILRVALFLQCFIWRIFYFVWICSRLDSRVRRVIPRISSSELSSHQKAHPNLFRSRLPS